MFIKIINQEVIKEHTENGHCVKEIVNTIEHNYEVSNYSLFPSLPEERKEAKQDKLGSIRTNFPIKEMNVALQFFDGNKGWDKTFSFPVDADDRVIEVYVMNNQGRTMERYIY